LIALEDDENEAWVTEQADADDAAVAIAYTLRTLACDDSQDAEFVARHAYEALDYHVNDGPGYMAEEVVLANPLVQAELSRQRLDLEEVRGSRPRLTDVARRVRERALNDAPGFFGPSSG